jgi:hypothetical protein
MSKKMTDTLTGAVFDDFAERDTFAYGDEDPDKEREKYVTQVCAEHAKQHNLGKGLDRGTGVGICGVVGCEEQANHHYRFNAQPKAPRKQPAPAFEAPPPAPAPSLVAPTPTTITPPPTLPTLPEEPPPTPGLYESPEELGPELPTEDLTPEIPAAEEEPQLPAPEPIPPVPAAEETPPLESDLYREEPLAATGTQPSPGAIPWKPKRRRGKKARDPEPAVAGIED